LFGERELAVRSVLAGKYEPMISIAASAGAVSTSTFGLGATALGLRVAWAEKDELRPRARPLLSLP
jgi:hypothetical protein